MKAKGEIILQGGIYDNYIEDHVYKVHMKLTLKPEKATDFGIYKCVAKNSLGSTEETIKILRNDSLKIFLKYMKKNN